MVCCHCGHVITEEKQLCPACGQRPTPPAAHDQLLHGKHRSDDPVTERFNPETGEWCRFGPRQTPPKGWKRLRPVPPINPSLPPGSRVTYIPGREPRLFVHPENGESKWFYFGEHPPQGWKPLRRRRAMPPLAKDEGDRFNPETGEWFRFGPRQTPPDGWKPLRPIPPRDPWLPPGSTVTYIPGREPRLFVDPETGESKWIYHGEHPGDGWKPLQRRPGPPPLTQHEGDHFDPGTGEWFRFGPRQTPPDGWKPLRPIPPRDPWLPPGSTVTYIPGREPRLFVDPETGEPKWIYFGEHPPQGWKPLRRRPKMPPLTQDEGDSFDPQTGEWYRFGPGQTPPDGWKPLRPVPPRDPWLPPGSTVTYIPGREPRLFVDPETGEPKWIYFGEEPPQGWKPLLRRPGPPPLTQNEGDSFNPQNGEWRRFGPGQPPPSGWRPLRPIPPRDPWLPRGATVTYIPGREPRLYVNPETGEARWVYFGEEPPAGWKPLVWRPGAQPPVEVPSHRALRPPQDEGQKFSRYLAWRHWYDYWHNQLGYPESRWVRRYRADDPYIPPLPQTDPPPPPPPRIRPVNPLVRMTPYERIGEGLSRLWKSGALGPAFGRQLKGLLTVRGLLFMALFMLLGQIGLTIAVLQAVWALNDAIDVLEFAEDEATMNRGVRMLADALAGIGLMAILSALGRFIGEGAPETEGAGEEPVTTGESAGIEEGPPSEPAIPEEPVEGSGEEPPPPEEPGAEPDDYPPPGEEGFQGRGPYKTPPRITERPSYGKTQTGHTPQSKVAGGKRTVPGESAPLNLTKGGRTGASGRELIFGRRGTPARPGRAERAKFESDFEKWARDRAGDRDFQEKSPEEQQEELLDVFMKLFRIFQGEDKSIHNNPDLPIGEDIERLPFDPNDELEPENPAWDDPGPEMPEWHLPPEEGFGPDDPLELDDGPTGYEEWEPGEETSARTAPDPAVDAATEVSSSAGANIPAGAATQLAFAAPPPNGISGQTLAPAVAVHVRDAGGNVVGGSALPVTISSAPAGVGGTLTVHAVNGVATFNDLKFTAAGSYTLTAAASGLPQATSEPVRIGAG